MGLAADGVPQPQTITPTDFERVPSASRLGTCARSGIVAQCHSDGHRARRLQEAVALDRQLTVWTVAAALAGNSRGCKRQDLDALGTLALGA